MSVTERLFRSLPSPIDRSALWLGLAVVGAEALAVAVYLLVAPTEVTDPLILVYPFVWINVGVWAILTTRIGPASRQLRWLAASVGIGYFLLLSVAGGIVDFSPVLSGASYEGQWRVVVSTLPPGWSPAVVYRGSIIGIVILPYQLIGYLALAYLVAATVVDAAGSALAGVVGLFSCVSCTWPLVGMVASSVFGGASAIAGVAMAAPYGISTLVFLSAVALLVWRPTR